MLLCCMLNPCHITTCNLSHDIWHLTWFLPPPYTQWQQFLCNSFFPFWLCLDIKLATTYRGRVEGLCGDFDGRYRNDFKNPDGVWVRNVNVFGESWKVPLKRSSRLRYLIFYLISTASTSTRSEWIKSQLTSSNYTVSFLLSFFFPLFVCVDISCSSLRWTISLAKRGLNCQCMTPVQYPSLESPPLQLLGHRGE